MDETTILAAASCAVLAVLVYLMWDEAAKPSWQALTQSEKKNWRNEEEKRKEKPAS